MSKHKNKHIRNAITYAEMKSWRLLKASGTAHVWGTLLCPQQDRTGCKIWIFSTPRNLEAHSKDIVKVVESCLHTS